MSAAAGQLTRRCVTLGLIAAAFWPAGAWGSEASAAETVRAIYRRASAGKGDSGGQFLWLKSKDRRLHFTKRTAELWDRADKATARGDQHPPGFDPVTASQDPGLKSYEIVLEEDGPDRARILVRLTGHEQPGKSYASLRYVLLRENGRWLIDDMSNATPGEEPWALRALLETHVAENRKPPARRS